MNQIVLYPNQIIAGFTFDGAISTEAAGGDLRGNILLADALTVATARLAISSGSVGVVTKAGNFACHGANILRCERSQNPKSPGGIVGLSIGSAARLVVDGHLISSSGQLEIAKSSRSRYISMYERDTANSVTAVCLWPHRKYDPLEYELQAAGLSISASSIVGAPVSCRHGRDGRIWFEGEYIDNNLILSRLLQSNSASKLAFDTASQYDSILIRMSSWRDAPPDLPTLMEVGREFFSTLLPFHVTYPDVLLSAATNLMPSEPNSILDIALANPVSDWLTQLSIFTDSAKTRSDPTWRGVLPPFGVSETAALVAVLLGQFAPASSAGTSDSLMTLAYVSVVKEFKMIIAKNLFAWLPPA